MHLSLRSNNQKTGPIPVSTSPASTCPDACPFKNNGCYAQYGPLKMHWDKVSAGERGTTWRQFLDEIRSLPEGQLWRHNQAGDLPGIGNRIDRRMLTALAKANRGRRGFTYTHKPMTGANPRAVAEALSAGFAINLSSNNLAHADELAEMELAPVVTVVAEHGPEKGTTPAGRPYIVCPAQTRDNVTCESCGLCANMDSRRPIIAFRAHGTGKKRIEAQLA